MSGGDRSGKVTRQELVRLLTHKVKIEKLKRGSGGDMAVLETHEDMPAFVQYGREVVTDKQGEQVVVAAIVFIAPNVPLDVNHEHYRITPTAPLLRAPMQAVRVDPIDDPRTGQTHHIEIAANQSRGW